MHIFSIFFRLGLTAFGGPTAHIAFFRDEFVDKRQWLSEAEYLRLVTLCQLLPGPASSQVGFALGLQRGGWSGAVLAFLGFTLPAAVMMGLLGAGVVTVAPDSGALAGLQMLVVVVVAHALLAMARGQCITPELKLIAAATGFLLLLFPSYLVTLVIISICLFSGSGQIHLQANTGSKRMLIVFSVGLVGALLSTGTGVWGVFSDTYLAGALVFGGGHVVLPWLTQFSADALDSETVMTGYALVQAMPGPLFTLASFVGAAGSYGIPPLLGWLLASVVIFVPGFLLLAAALPMYEQLIGQPALKQRLARCSAVVIGLLAATWFNPILAHGIDSAMALIGVLVLTALYRWRPQPFWRLLVGSVAYGWLFL